MHTTENTTSRRNIYNEISLSLRGLSTRKIHLVIVSIVVAVLVVIATIVVVRYINKKEKNETDPVLVDLELYSKWKEHAITVTGGNGRGNQTNQLNRPQGIFIDNVKTIYIADNFNNRVVQWKHGEKEGKIIAGGEGQGNRTDQLYSPIEVIIDKPNNVLIITDDANRHVIRWSIQNKSRHQDLISDIDCWAVVMDKDGSMYISDRKKHEVRRWKKEEKRGQIVAGGNGEGNDLNQLHGPTFIFIDNNYSLYISDEENYRVVKWTKDALEGIVVAGGNGYGNSLRQLTYPEGLFVDRWGRIYVADYNNHRVMRWTEGSAEGELLVGGNSRGDRTNQLAHPTGLAFDNDGNLYVADKENNRIQKFEKDLD